MVAPLPQFTRASIRRTLSLFLSFTVYEGMLCTSVATTRIYSTPELLANSPHLRRDVVINCREVMNWPILSTDKKAFMCSVYGTITTAPSLHLRHILLEVLSYSCRALGFYRNHYADCNM
ncbi:hypothetical protein BD413DRAFT_583055 [Trametes elegans]|nr:hypothetical protein BD413DRAFT_583055 [Trametes elegans]